MTWACFSNSAISVLLAISHSSLNTRMANCGEVSEGYITLSRTKIMPMVAAFHSIERTSGTPKA